MIAVVGGYGVGMTMRVERAPSSGETVTNGSLSFGAGGKGSNQAIGIARLGHPVSLFTGIGADSAGDEARRLWETEGVEAAAVVTAAGPTMTAFITVDATGENRISIAPGALASLAPGDLEGFRDRIRAADLLVVSLEVPVAVALRALAIAREEGTRTLLNPAPAAEFAPPDWDLVDILTPNATEAVLLLGRPGTEDEPEAMADALAAATRCDIVITRGADGSVVRDGAGTTRILAVPVACAVDTTGAGDSFTAALATALVEGAPLREAARFASAAGAHAVTIRHVVPALPTRDDVTTMLRGSEATARG